MLVMSASMSRLRLAAIVLIMVLILTITILPSVDNAHYVRNDGKWESTDTPQEMLVFADSKVIRPSNATSNPVLYTPGELETLAREHGITGDLNNPCVSVMNGDWNTTSVWITGVM